MSKKRVISLALIVLILCTLFPIASASEPLTEQAVYDKIIAMKSQYPEGMRWTNANHYSWVNILRPEHASHYTTYTIDGYGCVAFAMILSDAAFGTSTSAREHEDFSQLRVGDIVRVNNDTHSVIVLEITPTHIIIAEGNYNSSVHWERKITVADFAKSMNYIWTRYPVSEPRPLPELIPNRAAADGFVTRLYNLCLGRQPHPDEMKGWVDALVSGDITGTRVAYGFFFSMEMTVYRNLSNADFAEILYNTLLDRPSDAPGKADWVSALDSGAYTREQIFYLFAASNEFGNVCAGYGIQR